MHGSAARGIAIPFARPPPRLPCPPPHGRLVEPRCASSPRLLPPLLTLSASRSLPLLLPVDGRREYPSALPPRADLFRVAGTPRDAHTLTRMHAAYRKLNSRQRARRACSQLRGARGTKLNDRGVFRLLRLQRWIHRRGADMRRTKWDRRGAGRDGGGGMHTFISRRDSSEDKHDKVRATNGQRYYRDVHGNKRAEGWRRGAEERGRWKVARVVSRPIFVP